MRNILLGVLLTALLCAATDKKPAVAQVSNDKLSITATVIALPEDIERELGMALPPNFILVRVELAPKGGKPLDVDRDNFILHDYNTGERCGSFEPTQIAGRGGIALRGNGQNARAYNEKPGTTLGIPGLGGARFPGSGGHTGSASSKSANSPTPTSTPTSTAKEQEQDNPLLAALRKKILPEGETSAPVSGLLYFSIEGKHKIKDLGLQYIGPAGRLVLDFH